MDEAVECHVMKDLTERQRAMRDRMREEGEGLTPGKFETIRETLERIKSAPHVSHDDQRAVMQLIDGLAPYFDPMEIAMLQMDAVVRHYNANRKPGDDEVTVADILLRHVQERRVSLR